MLPWPFRAAELVLRMVLVTPEMEIVEVMVMFDSITHVLPSVVAQEERAENVLTVEVLSPRRKMIPDGARPLE